MSNIIENAIIFQNNSEILFHVLFMQFCNLKFPVKVHKSPNYYYIVILDKYN